MLQFIDASFFKNEIPVLHTLSCEFHPEDCVAIYGAVGSGKSMFLDAILKKIFPSQGSIKFDATQKIIGVHKDYSFHRIVGGAYQYYQQRFQQDSSEVGPSLREVLMHQVLPLYTLDLKSVDILKPKYEEKWLQEVCYLFDIGHLLDRKITGLSHGETRRSLLAYSYLEKPDVWVLDNPSAGLDIQHRKQVQEILSKLSIPIFWTGRKEDAPDQINKVIHLENGTLAFCGVPTDYEVLLEKNSKNTISPSKTRFDLSPVLADFTTCIELKNTSVRFGEKTILSDIDWKIQKGEKWALMGINGSGKSSLLSLITGDNLQCYSNDIWLFDKKRGTGESIWDIKKKLGFVSPEMHTYFNRNIRIWKVVASGLLDTIGLHKEISSTERDKVDSFLDAFGLLALAERSLSQVSFGQQRAALIARALIKNPPLLILDEPCQGLDYEQMLHIRGIIEQLIQSDKITLLYVSHTQEEIPSMVDKFYVLEDGRGRVMG
ncbi:MAG: ATP-binding cassette domain-containing protein [Leadbetterella sp.]